MRNTDQDIIREALALPKKKRSQLIKRLIESLDGPSDPDAPAAWEAEINRRIKLIDSGKAKWVTWPAMRKRVRGILRGRNKSSAA